MKERGWKEQRERGVGGGREMGEETQRERESFNAENGI